jgi:hypothetical protein
MGRIRLAVTVSNWLQPDAETSPERMFCHVHARGKNNAQIIPGCPYPLPRRWSPAGRTSWTGAVLPAAPGPEGTRGRPAAPAGVTCSRILAAWAAVISLARPLGTSSQSTAWSRQATWLRDRPRSRCRLAHTFSTAAWTSLALGVLYGCICGTVVNFILDVGGNTSNLVTRNRRALPPGYLHMAGAKCGRSTDRQANDQTADQIGGSVGVLRRRVYHVA